MHSSLYYESLQNELRPNKEYPEILESNKWARGFLEKYDSDFVALGRKNYTKLDSPVAFLDLPIEKQKVLIDWIISNFEPIKSFNRNNTSYGLKHYFERFPNGFYINNGQFKGAMLVVGFRVANIHNLNWNFNVSKRSIESLVRQIEFMKSLGV